MNKWLFYFLIFCGACSSQKILLKHKGNKLYLKDDKGERKSISVFSKEYVEYLILDDVIYYTDNLVTPDRFNITINK
ncbi:hypothetical protein, partial [Fulvivirga kasyanovii]